VRPSPPPVTATAPSIALGVAAAVALVVVTFASEGIAGRLALCQAPGPGWAAASTLAAAILVLALAFWAAASWTRPRAPRRGPGRLLVAISAIAVALSGSIALLGIGFWVTAAHATIAQSTGPATLYAIAVVGPSMASLASAILVTLARSRPIPTWLPPLVFIAVTAASVGIPILGRAAFCH
jgi:hypothetical protein